MAKFRSQVLSLLWVVVFLLVQFSVFAKLLWVSAAHVRFRDEPGTYTASYTVRRIPFSSSLLSRIPHTLIFSVRAPLSKSSSKKNRVLRGVLVTTLLRAVLYRGHPWDKARIIKENRNGISSAFFGPQGPLFPEAKNMGTFLVFQMTSQATAM